MISAHEAIVRLQEGNRRFVTGVRNPEARRRYTQSVELVAEQRPIATILSCSDARVPPEIVFDQSLSDLFVVRVVGNIVAPAQVGSIEYAAKQLGTPLVVVLGHSQCGGVQATIAAIHQRARMHSPNLESIIDRIRPSIEDIVSSADAQGDSAELVQQAVRANVSAAVRDLEHSSAILKELMDSDKLTVIGAEYSLETGIAEFLPNK